MGASLSKRRAPCHSAEDAPEEEFPSMANVVEAVSQALHEEGLAF